ncbi:MAG TPA: DsbA family protein [Tissierellia bacterium]|nr:DsbA family protein [Tissierellia bacterium]
MNLFRRTVSKIIGVDKSNLTDGHVQIYYFTDPICSHCFVMEPIISKLLLKYGDRIDYTVIMGGMLEKWDDFGDAANNISQAGDVYSHWREVSLQTHMPINGSVWLRDPIASSYPASKVFNMAEEMYPDKKHRFLRRIREAVFVFDENISRPEVLMGIAEEMGFDAEELLRRAESDEGSLLLKKDLHTTGAMGVRAFPTLMIGTEDEYEVLIGSVDYATLEATLKRYLTDHEPRRMPPLMELLQEHTRLYYRELEILYDLAPAEVDDFIKQQADERAELVEFYDGYYLHWREDQ